MRSATARIGTGLALIIGCCFAAVVLAQPASADRTSFFNSTDVSIPDGPSGGTAVSTTPVSGVSGPIVEVEVALFIQHPNDADLDITVRAPDGTGVVLSTDNGGTGDNYGTTSCAGGVVGFDDDSAQLITSQTNGVPAGSFRPEGLLSAFDGKSGSAVNGNWRLEVTDDSAANTGVLTCWNLIITTPPTISIATASVVEGRTGTKAAQFNVTLSGSSPQIVTVDYASSDGSAIAGADYSPTFGTLTFNPGETSKTITVLTFGDLVPEGNEAFIVSLSDPVHGSLGISAAFGLITDDEVVPVVDLTAPTGTLQSPVPVDATFTDDHPGVWDVIVDGDRVATGSGSPIHADLVLPDGAHNVRVIVTDEADNATLVVHQIVVDSTPPTLDIVAPTQNRFTGSPAAFRANITDATPVSWKLLIDGVQKATGTTSGTDAINRNLSATAGEHNARFEVTDAAGNTTVKTRKFTIDNLAPTVTLKTPGSGATVGSPVHIRANVNDTNAVTWTLFVDDTTVATDTTKGVDAVDRTVPLGAGPHTLLVQVVDAAGHVTTRTRGFTVS